MFGFKRFVKFYQFKQREEQIKKPELSFSIEWRDQSIRKLEALLKVEGEELDAALARIKYLREQLDETCRRKGIRDEENNKLRAEVDRLAAMNAATERAIDQYIEANEDLRAEVELKRQKWTFELEAEVACLQSIIESMTHWMKEKDETILRLSKEIEMKQQVIGSMNGSIRHLKERNEEMRRAIEDDQIG